MKLRGRIHGRIAILVGLAGLWTVWGAENPLLPPAYEAGREYTIRTEQRMEMTLPAGPAGKTAQKQVTEVVMEMIATCEKAKGRGEDERQLTTRIAVLRMKMSSGASSLEFDSAKPPETTTPLTEGFKNLAGAEFVIFLAPDGSITGADSLEEFAGKESNPLGQQLGAEQLKSLMVNALKFGIPAAGVLPGAKWDYVSETKLPPAGALKMESAMTYTANENVNGEDLAVIEFTGKASLKTRTSGGPADPRLSLTADKGTVTGTVRIDRKLNFPKRGKSELKLNLSMPNPAAKEETLRLPATVTESFELVSTKKLGLGRLLGR